MRFGSITICVLLFFATARAQESSELTPAGRKLLDQLARAGWSGSATAGGLTISFRNAAICSQGMRDAIRAGNLSAEQREALGSVGRATIREDGWFFGAAVKAGEYRIGLERVGSQQRFVLYEPGGNRVGIHGFWIQTPSDNGPSNSIATSGRATIANVRFGGISFSMRYVPRATHEALVKGFTETRSGPVVLVSDVPDETVLKTIADEAAAAVPIHAKLLGGAPPKGPFRIYLMTGSDTYKAMDRLVTGGNFQANGAFTADLTGHAYIHFQPFYKDSKPPLLGTPPGVRALVLHELLHIMVAEMFPNGGDTWPAWLEEGLAEAGTRLALEATSKEDGVAFHRMKLGKASFARQTGTLAQTEDFFGDSYDHYTGYYSAAYLFARRLAAKPKALRPLLEAVDAELRPATAHSVALRYLNNSYGSGAKLYKRVLAEIDAARKKGLPHVYWGRLVQETDGWRVAAYAGSASRVLLSDFAQKSAVEIKGSFAFHPMGQKQADFYFAFRKGRRLEQFLKVAVMQKAILLFHFRHGTWTTIGRENYDAPLKVGTAAQKAWHPIKIQYDSKTGVVRVEMTGGRWAQFECTEYVPLVGTRIGIGTFSSVVYFKRPKITK